MLLGGFRLVFKYILKKSQTTPPGGNQLEHGVCDEIWRFGPGCWLMNQFLLRTTLLGVALSTSSQRNHIANRFCNSTSQLSGNNNAFSQRNLQALAIFSFSKNFAAGFSQRCSEKHLCLQAAFSSRCSATRAVKLDRSDSVLRFSRRLQESADLS